MSISGQLTEFSVSEIFNAVEGARGRMRFWNLPQGHQVDFDLSGGCIQACRFGEHQIPVTDPREVVEKLCLVVTSNLGQFEFRKQDEDALEHYCRLPVQATLLGALARCDEIREDAAHLLPPDLPLRWTDERPSTVHDEFDFLLQRGAAYLRAGISAEELARELGVAVLVTQDFLTLLHREGYLIPVEVAGRPPQPSSIPLGSHALPEKIARARWFYREGQEEKGPVAVQEILDGIASGRLPANVLVWRADLTRWAPFEEVWLLDREDSATEAETAPAEPLAPTSGECIVCKKPFQLDEMLYYQGWHVCTGCREVFFRQLVQNPVGGLNVAPPLAPISYRFVAWALDFGTILVGTMLVVGLLALTGVMSVGFIVSGWGVLASLLVGSLVLHVAWQRWLGNTPGKWALRLFLTDLGGALPLRLDRLLLRWLAGLPLPLYPLVFLDAENRAPHDRVARSLVVNQGGGQMDTGTSSGSRFPRILLVGVLLLGLGAVALAVHALALQKALWELSDPAPFTARHADLPPPGQGALSQRWLEFVTGDQERQPFFVLTEGEARSLVLRSEPKLGNFDVQFEDRQLTARLAVPLQFLGSATPDLQQRFLNVRVRGRLEKRPDGVHFRVESVRCKDTRAEGLILAAAQRFAASQFLRELAPVAPTLRQMPAIVIVPDALEVRR